MATNVALESLSAEEIDMLRDAFIYMDKDNDGHINKWELLDTVRRCVGNERYTPLEKYLIPLFDVADQDRDDKLSLEEFLLSFANGPGVVPGEVINSCVSSIRVRLTDEEIATLQEKFRCIDTNADGYIDKEELVEALKENLKYKFPDLTDNNYHDIVAVIMASADADSDGRLCLSEFIRSFQEDQGVLPAAFIDPCASSVTQMLTDAEIEVLTEAFAVLDKNHDGFVEFADVYDALWSSLSTSEQDANQIRELCDLIMVTADRNKSGVLTLADFVAGFTQNMELLQLPVAIAQERVRTACAELKMLFESGKLEHLSVTEGDDEGCVNPVELVSVLCDLFADAFPSLDKETISCVMGAAVVASDKGGADGIGLDDFICAFAQNNRSSFSPALGSRGPSPCAEAAVVTGEELQVVSQVLQEMSRLADHDGCVQEPDVLDAVRAAFAEDPRQADRIVQYVRDHIVRHSLGSSAFTEVSDAERVDWTLQRRGSPGCVEPRASPVNSLVPLRAEDIVEPKATVPALLATRTAPNEKQERSLVPIIRLADTGAQKRIHARRFLDSTYNTSTGIYDDDLRRQFEKYAPANQSYIDRTEFKRIYMGLEHYGLTPSERDVDRLLSKYCKGNKVTYEQFCVIMLQRARM